MLGIRDDAIPDTIKSWRVIRLPIVREGRHLDKSAQLDFYKALDEHIKSRRMEVDH